MNAAATAAMETPNHIYRTGGKRERTEYTIRHWNIHQVLGGGLSSNYLSWMKLNNSSNHQSEC